MLDKDWKKLKGGHPSTCSCHKCTRGHKFNCTCILCDPSLPINFDALVDKTQGHPTQCNCIDCLKVKKPKDHPLWCTCSNCVSSEHRKAKDKFDEDNIDKCRHGLNKYHCRECNLIDNKERSKPIIMDKALLNDFGVQANKSSVKQKKLFSGKLNMRKHVLWLVTLFGVLSLLLGLHGIYIYSTRDAITSEIISSTIFSGNNAFDTVTSLKLHCLFKEICINDLQPNDDIQWYNLPTMAVILSSMYGLQSWIIPLIAIGVGYLTLHNRRAITYNIMGVFK